MKRISFIITLLLTAVLVFLPSTARADEVIAGGKWDGGPVTWQITSDGTLTISGNRSVQESLSYPWIEYSHLITKIVVEDGITTIPSNAFKFMTNATEVYIGNKVASIDEEAFWGCTGLTSLTLPASLKSIGAAVFYGCTNLKSIHFAPNGQLSSIGAKAFYECGLTSLTTPASLRSIEISAFENCTALESLILTDGLESLATSAFYGCWNVKELYLGETFSTGTHHFKDLVKLEKLTTHAPITPYFSGCKTLKELYIGGKASIIGTGCFEDCTALTTVVIDAPVTKIGASAFWACTSLTEISLCEGITEIDNRAFQGTGLVHVTLPDSLTTLGDWVFIRCENLISVDCGNGLTEIGTGTFQYCTKLTTVDLGNVKNIHREAFDNCNSLQDVKWSSQLEQLGENAFHNCYQLPSVTLPGTLTTIDIKAFKTCTKLKRIVFLGDAPTFEYILGYDTENPFCSVTATVYYPQDNPTWSAHNMLDYGGSITWTPLCQVHTPTQVPARDPTCSQAGKTASEECAVCGALLTQWQLIAPLPHQLTVTQREPSCGVTGAYVHACDGCDYEYEIRYADALVHSYGQWEQVRAATHNSQGEKRRGCTFCSHYETKIIPTVSHSYGEWVVEKEPDYGVEGEERAYCTGCDHYESRILAALVPEVVDDSEPATRKPNILWVVLIATGLLAAGGAAILIIDRKKHS